MSDYAEAFRILNGLAMFDILATLDELKTLGYVAELRDHLGDAQGVNFTRLRLAISAVEARNTPAVPRFLDENAAELAALPDEQRSSISHYLGVPARPDPAPAVTPVPETPPVAEPTAPADVPVPPTCVRIPDLPESATLCRDVGQERFGGDAVVAQFAHDLATCYAERAADRLVRERHAAAVRAAQADARTERVAGETAAQRRDRIAAAGSSVPPPDRDTIRDEATREREAWLATDYQATMRAAGRRFGADCHVYRVARGWMVAPREQGRLPDPDGNSPDGRRTPDRRPRPIRRPRGSRNAGADPVAG